MANLLHRARRECSHAPLTEPALPDPAIIRIADAQERMRLKVCGQVVRMRARPASGLPALAVTISDDTGTLVAVWSGRRTIAGVTLGRRLIVEGITIRRFGQLEIANPAYTLLPDSRRA